VSGTGTGNIVRYNYVYNNVEHSFPTAIRCDDDQHETLIYGNILDNNYGWAQIVSKGINDIINNFIVRPVNVPRWGYVTCAWYSVTGSKIQRNIVIAHPEGGLAHMQRPRYQDRSVPGGGPELIKTDMDSNLYFHPSDAQWVDEHLSMMRAAGKEKASLIGDPLFTDPTGGDFSFRPGSPALALGIEPLDASKMGRLGKRSFLNSDGSRFVSKARYPKFSWDSTPLYYMFGDGQRVLHPEEVEFIAKRADFLCIEKSHGSRQLGAAELGAKHEAAAFKELKPDMKVLFYFNAARAWPFTSYSKHFRPETIDDHPELNKLLLVNPETGQLERQGSTYCFDVLKPEMRQWWVDTVAKGVAESGCDGAFIDQMHGYAWLRPDKSNEVEKAMGQLMAALKEAMGPDKILLANNAHQAIAKHVFPVMDACMFEHYRPELLTKEALLRDWDDMLHIAKAGKMSIFRIGVESDRSQSGRQAQRISRADRAKHMAALAKERLEYYLACYLIGAQPYSYFQYGWGWNLADGSLYDYPELRKPLGAPKGPYQRTNPDGWEFTREFEHAHVWVDTEKGQAKITWQ